MTAKLFFLITQLLLIFFGHDPASGPCSTSQVWCQYLASAFLYHQDVPGPCCFVTSPSFPMLAPSPTNALLRRILASGHCCTTRSMTAKLFFLITQLLLIFFGHDPASGPCSTSQVWCQDLASAFLYPQDVPGPCCFVTSPSFRC
uniref:Putative secreted protein n=1 Tax=Ixodes ricinus TaxID=34613 RepID=A0A6B0UUZ0_IXORI